MCAGSVLAMTRIPSRGLGIGKAEPNLTLVISQNFRFRRPGAVAI